MLPAAPVTQKTVSEPRARSGSASAARSWRPTDQRRSSAWPISTAPGSPERLGDQRLGDRRGLAAGREVDSLDQRLLALPGKGLDEPGHGPAHRRGRAGGVVAVPAPEARARDQEGPLGPDLLGQAARRDRQQLHPPPQPLVPGVGLELCERRLGVEGRQPVDAVHRAGLRPGFDLALEGLVLPIAVGEEDLDPDLLEPRDQRLADPALVQHHDHPTAGLERDPGRHAVLEGRAHDRHRDAAREAARTRFGRRSVPGHRGGLGRRLCLCLGLQVRGPLLDEARPRGSGSGSRAASGCRRRGSRRTRGSRRRPRPA